MKNCFDRAGAAPPLHSAIPMRHPQFSLKQLLFALTLGCVALGTWSLYSSARYVTADHVVVGQPIRVRGRFLDLHGVEWETCYLRIERQNGAISGECVQSRGIQVRRTWPGIYHVDADLPPIKKPGKYRLVIWPMTKAVMAGHRNLAEEEVASPLDVSDRN